MLKPMRWIIALVFLLGAPAGVFAQSETGGPPQNVRMRIGPLFVNPTLALSNAGVDTNVFNEATNPKSDYTITVTPATDLWLRFGPTWFQGNIKEDIVWFNKYASERSANNSYSLKWRVPLNRLTVTPTWTYANTRERPGFEIDARSQRTETGYGGTIELRAQTKTFFSVSAERKKTDYDKAAVFLGANLHDQLNRTVTTETVSVRHQLTPLTSISFDMSKGQDRFDFDPLRDSDSIGFSGRVNFDPAALIKGSASFGYRDFRPASPDLPGFQGSIAAVDVNYVLLGTTKFAVQFNRDVQYSYDINQPYYVQTGGTASISQQLFGPLDIVVRGGLQRLEYQTRTGAVVAVSNRVDHTQAYGGGIGYHLGRDTRIGFNIDQSRRISGVELRQFKGLEYGFAVTYGP